MPKQIAKALLELKAVKLSPNDFFTWTSGIKSPIYCDNRMLISHVPQRRAIVQSFVKLLKAKYPDVGCVAGTATAGIPWAAWIAEELELPMVYIRSKAKEYGTKSAIEGDCPKHAKVVIIEDLISTGKSSVAAANEVKAAGLDLLGVTSIFTYGLSVASQKFSQAAVDHQSLCSLEDMMNYASDSRLLSSAEIEIIRKWKNTIELT